MPLTLSCPGCRATVPAADADRGKTVRCGICWDEIPVPAGSGAAAVPAARVVARARPVPAKPPAPPPTAADELVILDDPPAPAAARPVARAVAVRPAVAVAASPSKATPVAAPRAKPRHRGDDEDDDRPAPQRSGKGKVILAVAVIGGGALVAALAGGAFLAYRASSRDVVTAPTLPTSAPPPGFFETVPGPASPKTRTRPSPEPKKQSPAPADPKKPNWAREWAAVNEPGSFAARMPERVRRDVRADRVDPETLTRTTVQGSEGGMNYKVDTFDLPDEMRLSAEEFVQKVTPPATLTEVGPRATTLGTVGASEYVRRTGAGQKETLRAAKVGCRVYLVSVTEDPVAVRRSEGLDPAAKAAEFFGSFQPHFDSSTPAPKSTARPKVGPPQFPPTQVPGQPPFGPPGGMPGMPGAPGGSPVLPGAEGGVTYAGAVDQHFTAVALAETPELLTFGGGPTTGVRKYSTATWKQLVGVTLPTPVIHAAVDERAGRLYVATVRGVVRRPEETLILAAEGDVQVYDLKTLFDGGPAKPLATFAAGGKVGGLAVDPKAKAVYALVNGKAGGPKPPAARVVKLTADGLKPVGAAIDLPGPALALALSPDGKALVAGEYPFNSFGHPQHGTPDAARVHVIDPAGWTKAKAVPVPGPVGDVRFVSANKAVVLVASAQPKLFSLTADGRTEDLGPDAPMRVQNAHHLAAGSGRVVVASRQGVGSEFFSLAGGGARKVGRATGVVGVPASGPLSAAGPVVLTPDGKFAVYGSGLVLDVSAVPADK